MKICASCKINKDELSYSKDSRRKSGLYPSCKQCQSEYAKKYKNHDISVLEKTCITCGIEKSSNSFRRDKSSSDGLRGDCVDCYNTKLRKYYASESGQKHLRKRNVKHRMNAAKSNASRRGIRWSLSASEYYSITDDVVCIYCNDYLPAFGSRLDRVDNSVGYIAGNVVPCCSRCNTIKSNHFTYEEMMLLGVTIKEIYKNRNND